MSFPLNERTFNIYDRFLFVKADEGYSEGAWAAWSEQQCVARWFSVTRSTSNTLEEHDQLELEEDDGSMDGRPKAE